MKVKYTENNLMYQIYRKDELQRLKKRIKQIKTRKPTFSHEKNPSPINLPLINSNKQN